MLEFFHYSGNICGSRSGATHKVLRFGSREPSRPLWWNGWLRFIRSHFFVWIQIYRSL